MASLLRALACCAVRFARIRHASTAGLSVVCMVLAWDLSLALFKTMVGFHLAVSHQHPPPMLFSTHCLQTRWACIPTRLTLRLS